MSIQKFKENWLQDHQGTYSPLWMYAYILGVCAFGYYASGFEGLAVMVVCIIAMMLFAFFML